MQTVVAMSLSCSAGKASELSWCLWWECFFFYTVGDVKDRKGSDLTGLTWRLILGAGALPGFMLLARAILQSTSRRGTADARPAPSTERVSLREALKRPGYVGKLIGCAGGWFLLDVVFFGNTLFAPTVLKSVFHVQKGLTPIKGDALRDNLPMQLLILALLALPGYYVAAFSLDRLGCKVIQLQGFFFLALFYFFLSSFELKMENSGVYLLLIYGLTYFFNNFGPNSTTFILPSETFPADVRSTLNGFCAASGKLGAALGTTAIKPLAEAEGVSAVFFLCGTCALFGFLLTARFIETPQNSHSSQDTCSVPST